MFLIDKDEVLVLIFVFSYVEIIREFIRVVCWSNEGINLFEVGLRENRRRLIVDSEYI